MPLLSIIIPAYNAEKTIAVAIDSVLTQKFNDYELIVVDDGSVDNTPQIIDNYAVTNPKIRPVHRENGGQAVARGHGLSLASGQWVLFLDSDDSYVNGAFETLMKHTGSSPDFILFGFNVFSDRKLLRTPNAGDVVVKCSDEQGFSKVRFLMASACNKMYKRSYIKVLFDKSVVHGEDLRFNYQNLTADTKIVSIHDCLYNVCLDTEGSVNKRYLFGRLKDTTLNVLIQLQILSKIFPGGGIVEDVLNDGITRIASCVRQSQMHLTKNASMEEIANSRSLILKIASFNRSTPKARPDIKILWLTYCHCNSQIVYRVAKILNGLNRIVRWTKRHE